MRSLLARDSVKLRWFRFLDFLQSWFNTARKEADSKRKFGPEWRNFVRPGRKYTRIAEVPAFEGKPAYFVVRADVGGKPGWEWYCPQGCGYSITATAREGCPNCKYRPGAPE